MARQSRLHQSCLHPMLQASINLQLLLVSFFPCLFLSSRALTFVRKAPASPKTPVPTILRDPRFRIHSVRQSVYRELIENPDPRPPLSADQMNRLQLGADDLNYWGYVIDIMYRQLSEVTNPVQQVAIITTIAAMFVSVRLALDISIILINRLFSNSKTILLLPTHVKRWTFPRPAISSNCARPLCAGSRTQTSPNPAFLRTSSRSQWVLITRTLTSPFSVGPQCRIMETLVALHGSSPIMRKTS